MNVTAAWTRDVEELADVLLTNEDELLAVWMQALKTLEHNVAHALDMVGTYLVLLLDLCICLTSCHEKCSGGSRSPISAASPHFLIVQVRGSAEGRSVLSCPAS